MPVRKPPYRPALLLAVLVLATTAPALAAKTDSLVLANGDRITGEIKGLERGQLRYATDSMGTVAIEWDDIRSLSSPATYVVELRDGTRIDGSLAPADDAGQLLVVDGQEVTPLAFADVVWIDPLKMDAVRIGRWDGSVSAGFDATKANSNTSLSGSFSARRRAERFRLNIDGSVFSRSQSTTEDSIRANLGAVYRGLLPDRWFWAGVGTVERNDELGIRLRSLAGAGMGRYLVQSGRTLWSVTGGLAAVNEQRAGNEDAETSAEGFLNTAFEYFTYNTPKTSLTTSLTLFPSLTDGGRLRGNLDLALRRELITDLFLEVSFYQSYDSDPPEAGAESDYGIVTGIGYSF